MVFNVARRILVLSTVYSLSIFQWTAAKQELSFETIGTLRMRSFGLDLTPDKNTKKEIKDVHAALSVRLSDDEKRRLVYQLCAQKDAKNKVNDDENLKTVVENLDIFFGQGKNAQDTIFNRLFNGNIQTFFGEAMAAKRMATVEVDQGQLRQYQECIKTFVDDQALFKRLDELLKVLKSEESNMLSFWPEQDPLSKKLVESLYFSKILPAGFNKDMNKLEALTRFENCRLLFDLCGDFAMSVGTFYLAKKLFGHPTSLKTAMHDAASVYNPMIGFDEIKFQLSQQAYQVRDYQVRQGMQIAGELLSEEQINQRNNGLKRANCFLSGLKVFSSCLNVFGKFFAIKTFFSDFVQKRDTANFLHTRLIGVARYMRTLKEINSLVKDHPALSQALPITQVYERLFNTSSADLRRLLDLLMTKTFEGDASFFSRTGRVLAAYTLMNNVKDELLDCLHVLGEVDAAMAVAKLYKSFASNYPATYSFAEFVTGDSPYIQAVDLWNPLVAPQVVVTNSIELGAQGAARNIILTGSNKGGKSTLLKAMMVVTLMAQTIAIVPARRYAATPFACLATYMNVTDDTAAGLSLFQSQVAQAKKLVGTVDMLSPRANAFIIIDEIFTGTGAAKAAKAAYKIAKYLSESPSVCFVFATHFVDELSKLEINTNGLCKNFKVDADQDANGKILYRHKLEEGVSTKNIANEILNDEFNGIDFGVDEAVA